MTWNCFFFLQAIFFHIFSLDNSNSRYREALSWFPLKVRVETFCLTEDDSCWLQCAIMYWANEEVVEMSKPLLHLWVEGYFGQKAGVRCWRHKRHQLQRSWRKLYLKQIWAFWSNSRHLMQTADCKIALFCVGPWKREVFQQKVWNEREMESETGERG